MTATYIGQELRVIVPADRYHFAEQYQSVCSTANQALTQQCAEKGAIPTNVKLLWMRHGDDPELADERLGFAGAAPQTTFFCFSAIAGQPPTPPKTSPLDRLLKTLGLQRIATGT